MFKWVWSWWWWDQIPIYTDCRLSHRFQDEIDDPWRDYGGES